MNVPNRLYIDGEWGGDAKGPTLEIVNPATEEKVDAVPMAGTADLDRALEAAGRAWRSWRNVDAWSRSAVLRRSAGLVRERADGIAAVITQEQGKPLAEAKGEVAATADVFDWYADEARRIYGRVIDGHSRDHRLLVMREPVGPVAGFSPWNFPALLSARKIAPSIAAGCSIILKPAEETPRAALCLAQACHDAEVPRGVVNVVAGDPVEISRHLIASDVIRKVSFTGSVPVGEEILRLCTAGVKSVSLELGGHAPVLVFEDADVEDAAETCARAKFRNNGQVCIAASRFYVQESVAERFTKRFVEVTKSLRIGDGMDPNTEVGPMANPRRLEATHALIEDAVGKGAILCCGGTRGKKRRRPFNGSGPRIC